MIDPGTVFTPEVQAFIFSALTYVVTQVSKKFHTDPMKIWQLMCILGALLYIVYTWNPNEVFWIQLPSKAVLIVTISAGLWHLVKKWTGQDLQEKQATFAAGAAAGAAAASLTEDGNPPEIKIKQLSS